MKGCTVSTHVRESMGANDMLHYLYHYNVITKLSILTPTLFNKKGAKNKLYFFVEPFFKIIEHESLRLSSRERIFR